jgi:2-polyprenyl-3-methyl-5-hydroxy-6-metoxy-1,4-benzoquinol methylase
MQTEKTKLDNLRAWPLQEFEIASLKLRAGEVNQKNIQIFKDRRINAKCDFANDINLSLIKPRFNWLIEKLNIHFKDRNKDELSILDLGSWSGGIASGLYEQGFKNITCVDACKQAIEFGKTHFPYLKFDLSFIEEYASDKKFDVVLLLEVLQYH